MFRAMSGHHASARDSKATLFPEHIHGLLLHVRAYHFRLSSSFRAALSSSDSAKSFFRFAFSASSSFSRLTSATVIPEYFAFQLMGWTAPAVG